MACIGAAIDFRPALLQPAHRACNLRTAPATCAPRLQPARRAASGLIPATCAPQ
jgi:hypothetical protein